MLCNFTCFVHGLVGRVRISFFFGMSPLCQMLSVFRFLRLLCCTVGLLVEGDIPLDS